MLAIKNVSIPLTLIFLLVTVSVLAQPLQPSYTFSTAKSGTYTASRFIHLRPGFQSTDFHARVVEDGYLSINLDKNENYVFTRVYQTPLTSKSGIQKNSDVIESVTYYDGLGRTKQQVAIKASSDKNDIVTHIAYDSYGRMNKQYLPFERSNGIFGGYATVDPVRDINPYYKQKYAEDFTGISANSKAFNAYSESFFEPSPLNRVLEVGAPGQAWKVNPDSDTDHTIKTDRATNKASEVVYFRVQFEGNNTESPKLVKDDFFDSGTLFKETTKDENWQPNQPHLLDHTSSTYTDLQGRVVCKITYDKNKPHTTYYVFDDFGNQTYVLPPKVDVSKSISQSILDKLCYQYKYDYRNRLIERKVPGKGVEYLVYNKRDELIATQDANQRATGEWTFTRYDDFGRVWYTGLFKTRIPAQQAKQVIKNQQFYQQFATGMDQVVALGGTYSFTSDDPRDPTASGRILTLNYYDTYAFFLVLKRRQRVYLRKSMASESKQT